MRDYFFAFNALKYWTDINILLAMNRNSYDQSTLHIFDTIAAYFLDIFYNHLYDRARQLVDSGRSQSITDAYRAAVSAYMSGIKSGREHYADTIKKLHNYYQQINNCALTLGDFEDKVLSKFIPKEFYRDFASVQKDAALRAIIIRTVTETAEILIGEKMLGRIIDYHGNRDDVIDLQDRLLHILMFQNEEYYAKFTKQIVDAGAIGGGNSSELVEVNKRIKIMYMDEKRRCLEALADRERAINIAIALAAKMRAIEDNGGAAANTAAALALSERQNNEYKSAISGLNTKLAAANTMIANMETKNEFLEQRISRLVAAQSFGVLAPVPPSQPDTFVSVQPFGAYDPTDALHRVTTSQAPLKPVQSLILPPRQPDTLVSSSARPVVSAAIVDNVEKVANFILNSGQNVVIGSSSIGGNIGAESSTESGGESSTESSESSSGAGAFVCDDVWLT